MLGFAPTSRSGRFVTLSDDGTQPLKVRRFSTDDLPVAERHRVWAGRGEPSVAASYDTVPIGPFESRSEIFQLGPLSAQFAEISSQSYARSAERAHADSHDAMAVCVMLDGSLHGIAGQREFRAGPGAVAITDMAQPVTHEATASRAFLLFIPRAMAEAAGLTVRELHGVVVRPEAATLLIAHVARVREQLATATVRQGEILGRTLVDLLAFSVAHIAAGAPAAPPGGHTVDAAALLAARDEIEARLGSPSLTVAWLCRRLHISRSALYRLFDGYGGVQAYIRARRLEQVRIALIDPRNTRRIGELAEHWGFTDAAHLSRLFRACYGKTPSEYRATEAPRR
ncbi:hypothetical protein BH09PSE4_BH09PSE4_07150 [soil metagenome]